MKPKITVGNHGEGTHYRSPNLKTKQIEVSVFVGFTKMLLIVQSCSKTQKDRAFRKLK